MPGFDPLLLSGFAAGNQGTAPRQFARLVKDGTRATEIAKTLKIGRQRVPHPGSLNDEIGCSLSHLYHRSIGEVIQPETNANPCGARLGGSVYHRITCITLK